MDEVDHRSVLSRPRGSGFVALGAVGYINEESGHGPWPLGLDLHHALRAVQRNDPLGTDDVGITAKLRRVRMFGLAARVELEGTDSARGPQFEVEFTHERASELNLRKGEAVWLVPSRLKVFKSNRAESAR
jgi:hypothetical protein